MPGTFQVPHWNLLLQTPFKFTWPPEEGLELFDSAELSVCSTKSTMSVAYWVGPGAVSWTSVGLGIHNVTFRAGVLQQLSK